MAERPLYTLYKGLKANNYDVPSSYDSFEKTLVEAGNGGANARHTLFNSLKSQGYDVPDTYESFYRTLFTPVNKTTSRAIGGDVPMSEADKRRFSAGAANISAQAGQTMQNAGRYNKLKNRQKKQKSDFGRVSIGTHKTPYGGDTDNVVKDDFAYNPETGKVGTYVNSDSEDAYNLAEAEQKQAALDQQNQAYQEAVNAGDIPSVFDVRDKNGNYDLQENVGKDGVIVTKEGLSKQLDAKLRSAYSERDRLNEMARKRMEEIDNREHQGFNDFMMMSNAASSAGGGLVGESEMATRKYENDETYRNIMTALRQNNATITTLEDEKTNQLNGFWHTLGTTIGNGYTFTDGMGVFNDVTSLMQAKKHLDSINKKKANGLPLSDKEKVLESVLNNTVINNVVQTMYGGDYGAWARAGATTAQSLDFMKDIMEFPGAASIAKSTASKVAGIGAKQLAKKAGENAVKAFAKKSARGFMKATGMLVGSHLAGAAISNTTGLGTTMGLVGKGMAGTVDTEKGNYVFRDAQKFIPSLIEAERNQIGENGSEMFGEFLPGGKTIVEGLGKIGLSKIANYLTAIGNKQWYKQYYELAKAGGYNGLLGEGLEEYEGILYDAITGHAGDAWSQLKDPQTHVDIWLGVGSMSVLLGAIPMAIQGTQTVGYYKYKNKLNHSDNAAYMAFGSNDREKWEELRDKIDNTSNDKISRLAASVAASRDTMSKDQIDATLNYINNLVKYRTYNIAEISNANETSDDDPDGIRKEKNQQIGNAYSEGQDAEDADKHNIQMEAEDQMTTLASMLGITEQQLSGMTDEELESLTGQDDKLDQAIYDYQLSTARYQGVVDNANDKVEAAAQQASHQTDMLTDKSRGTVRNATVIGINGEEDYGVYIISGKLATHEDGAINIGDSDSMIIYYDPKTQSVEHADARRFVALGDEVPAEEVKAQAIADAKEAAIKAEAGIIDGTVEVGTQFSTTDADGSEHTYEVLADNGDGTAMITIDGNVDENPHAFEELQQLKDAEDLKRLNAAKAQRGMMEEQQKAQEEEQKAQQQKEDEQKYAILEQITNADGNVQLIDVLDADGNSKYPGSQVFLISDDGAKAKVMEMDADGNLKPHAVNKKDIVKMPAMTAEEYKQTLPASNIEEDRGEIEAKEPSNEANEPAETTAVPSSPLLDAVRTLFIKGKEAAAKLFKQSFFDVAKTPDFMKKLGLTGDKFTIRYGVIARHFGKDGQHDFPIDVWEHLSDALKNPLVITKHFEKKVDKDGNENLVQKGFRLYTALQLEDGSYIAVGATVKNAGRNLEVNAIDTMFGRDKLSDEQDEVIYTNKEMTPEQEALLNGHNPHQYQPAQESEEGKLLYRNNGGAQTEQTQPSASVTTSQEGSAGSSEGKGTNNSAENNENNETLTLEDGTVVPMLEDGNPDFSQLTAEQTAELYDSQFGEDAEQIISGFVSEAKKALDKATNMTVKGKNFAEQKASKAEKDKAVAAAQTAYDSAKAISDAYAERQLSKETDTHEGRMNLIQKAKNKFSRLKNKDEWKNNPYALWNETVGKVLHRLYDGTSVDVFDHEPQTVEEYVSSNIAPYSLNFEGKENSKGVAAETGLQRKDFAKSRVLAAEGKGKTVDEFVHKLWDGRPKQLENVSDQEIRNALLSLITSDMNAYDMSHVIEDNRIAQAEEELENNKRAAENAAFEEEQRKAAEEEAKKQEEEAKKQAEAAAKAEEEAKNADTADETGKLDEEMADANDEYEHLAPSYNFENDENLSEEERENMVLRDGDTFAEYRKRNGVDANGTTTPLGIKVARAYIQQKYGDKLADIDAIFGMPMKDHYDGWLMAEQMMKIVDADMNDFDAALMMRNDNVPLSSEAILGYLDGAAELIKARHDAEKLGLAAFDSDGNPVYKSIINLANWAKEQGLEVDGESAASNYANLYLACKDGFGAATLVPDKGEEINMVFYFPEQLMGDNGEVNQARLSQMADEFNEGRDALHSAEADIELTDGAQFYNGDTAREFRDFVDKKTEEENKPFGEQIDESEVPFSVKDSKDKKKYDRAADVEKNHVSGMDVVDDVVGRKTRKAFDRLAKMMGAKIQWQYSDKMGNGWYDEKVNEDGSVERTIYLTLDSSIMEGAQFIFGHEMTHEIKSKNPAAYDELKNLIINTYGKEAFDKAVDETEKRYKDAGVNYAGGRAAYEEEVVADGIGEMIRDLNLAHTLALKMSHPLLAYLHEILMKIKRAFYGTEYSDKVKEVIRGIEQAYVKTAKGDFTSSSSASGERFSLRDEEVKEANDRFNNEIEDFKNKSHKGLMHLGAPSPILRASGVNVDEITLSPKVLNKKLNQHSLTTDDVKDLVNAIQDPIMVYKHGESKPNIVVITNAEIRGNKLSMALELDAAGNVTELNNVSSIHDKDADKEIERWLSWDDGYLENALRWVDKEKVSDWLSSAHLISYSQTENNQKLSSIAKVINDFENPNIEGEDLTNNNENVKYSLRQKEEPKKKGIGYKVFLLGKDGKLYPPMVANPDGAATPVGVWLDADAAPIAGESKTGRPQVKQGGKGTQGGSGKLAYRPGWHLGVIPYALQFNRKDAEGNKTLFPKNFVFAEVEYAADVDYQQEAHDAGINPSGKYQHSLAGLKHLPTDGYYMYRTNPNPETDPWVITGAMKVNRILTRAEQAELVKKAGREPQMIQDGDIVTDEIVNAINQEIANAPKFSLRSNNNLFGYFDGTIKDLIDSAKTSGSKLVKKIISTADDKLIGDLHDKGVDITSDYKHTIDNNAINHAIKRHGSEKERLQGQLPITEKDLENVSDVIDNYDSIETEKNKRGQDVIIYTKQYADGTTYYIEEVRTGRKELAMDSIRKRKTRKLTDANSNATPISDLSSGNSAAKIDNNSETAKENGEKVDSDAPKTFEEFLESPSLKFQIRNEEQRKAAESAYNWAVENRPDKWKQYALVNMANPQQMPEYYEKKALADKWRRFYNKDVRDDWGASLRKPWGNYKLFDLDQPFADQVNEVKGDVPNEFNTLDVVANKNADNESGAEYHEYKQGEPSSITYKDRYKAFKQREANRDKVADLRKQKKELEDKLETLKEVRFTRTNSILKKYMDEHKLSNEYEVPDDVWMDARKTAYDEYTAEADKVVGQIQELNKNLKALSGNEVRYSLKKMDDEYLKAVEDGDMEKAQKMVNEAAERAGYVSGSDYQGTSAFNGSAPWGNGYFLTKEERKEAWDNDEYDGDQSLGDYINRGIDAMNLDFIALDPRNYRSADPMRKEAIENVRNAIQKKSKTITMYRSVPADVKEGSFRNGDWVTPSRSYAVDNAKVHGWGDNYNIIEQKVPVDEIWWDGNDIAEWGYGREEDYINDTDFAYKNTKNNKKLLDAVTYDDNGNVIPLSQRFNEGVDDVRFSLKAMADGKEEGMTGWAEELSKMETGEEVDEAVKKAVGEMPAGWKMANKKAIHIAEALAENRKKEIDGDAPRFSLKENSLIKAGTYFSGGGLVEEGLKGIIDPVVAVEYDEKISGVYRNNFGQHIVTADVRDIDPKELVGQIDGEVEYFHASPVCKNYSQAKANHEEVEIDKETAKSTADFINQIKPKVVTIENVKGYKDSEAMKIITDALDKNGYEWDADVYNAADYGGYTNRERLIVRAVREGELPEKPKKVEGKRGWYEAVEDIMPTLTEKKNGVAPWMDVRLKADGIDWRNIDKPLYVMGSAYADGKIPHAFADELLPTLRTKSGDVIVMPDGKVYRAMGRVLARLSGVSDDYKLPYSESLAHTIIGNGIPTQLTEHVIAPLIQNTLHNTAPEGGRDTKFSLRYNEFEKDLEQWKKDNGLKKDAQRPAIPTRDPGESAMDFMKKVNEYRRQMALWATAPTYEGHLLTDGTALGEFNRELQRGSVLKRIAFQDSMLAIRKAQEAIIKEHGLDGISMAEDAYTAENRSHGKGKNELEEYNDEFLQPLRKAYKKMKDLMDGSYDNVKVYMMAKHGLERNAQMAFKKALENDFEKVDERVAAYNGYKSDVARMQNDADLNNGRIDYATWRQRDNGIRTKYAPSYPEYRYDKDGNIMDYSGLTALFEGAPDIEVTASDLVKNAEDKYSGETADLWNAVNAATKKILRDSYKAGMMSEKVYEYVRDMYKNYIPLRGWNETQADQVWDYIGGGKGAFNQTLKEANGRTSIADDPIAYIENMAESGILINNKNWVKQHLMLLAENHPTSLLTLSKAWYVKSTDAAGNETWIPASPQITSGMTNQQVEAAMEAFQKKMEKMEETGDATQQRGHLEITYPQTNSEEREHEVRVMKDGEEYVIYVNGDPQLAQAMNNTRAHRVREVQSGKLDRACAWLGRKMAAAYTSLSPLFIPSNYFRDLTMTLASTAIREDGRYNYLLRKNMATSWNMWGLLKGYKDGTLREKVRNGKATEKEQMFYDFMMNGGETGFVSNFDVEDLKKKFKGELKDMDRWAANPKKVLHTIYDSIEFMNRAIENSNRFAIYMTSIQYGRSIEEAVNNAKDVTLNFNRKGTGENGWQMIRNLYLFINPAVQSLQTLGALAKHHPYKFTAVTSAWMVSGALVPLINEGLMLWANLLAGAFGGGDDDDEYKDIKEKYWQFSKWDRRNNLIMWVPFTKEFVKIPLAQEFRGFYALGDMIASKLLGGDTAKESWGEYAEDLMGQVVDMLPLDPTGYDGNIAVSLMPNAVRPMFELAFNVDFTGKPLFKDSEYNKYDPNFTKAYAGTPDWLVRVSRMVNSIGNDYPDVQQNKIDAFGDPRYNLNNPAVVDHVLSSYLGGAYTMGSQVMGVLTKALNDPKEIKVADIPLVSKFVSNPEDRPVSKKQGDEFWTMKENHDRVANTLSKLKKQAKVDGDYSLLEQLYGSEEYKQYKLDDVKVRKYEEDKKKEKAEETGEEYKPHQRTADDVYKEHSSAKDELEDLKMKQIYSKLNSFKTSYDLLVKLAPKQSDDYYQKHKVAIDAINAVELDKKDISETKKDFLTNGVVNYDAEKMQKIRGLRKKVLEVLEKANKEVIAEQQKNAAK